MIVQQVKWKSIARYYQDDDHEDTNKNQNQSELQTVLIYDDFYFIAEHFHLTKFNYKDSIDWLNNKLSNVELVVNAIKMMSQSNDSRGQWDKILYVLLHWHFSKCCFMQYFVINADSETLSCSKLLQQKIHSVCYM